MKGKNKIVSDINITPLTDIILVLLIIFMITTPMLSQNSMKINLPKSENVEQTQENKTIEITIDKNGLVYLEKNQYHIELLQDAIENVVKQYPDRPIVIKGDKDVRYDVVVQVIDKSKKAGATKFALALEKKEKK